MTKSKTTTDYIHKMPESLAEVLTHAPKVQRIWNKLTPLARNEWICYVTIFKKPETRKEHIKRLQEDLLKGERRPCCWPGCPHRRPNAQRWFSKKERIL